MNKRLLGCFLMGFLAVQSMAQISATLSPYSQYGVGVLADQSLGFTRAMGGLGIGMRSGNQINMINPASYAAVDSLTMMFDFGLSAKATNLKENSKRVNAKTGNVDYIVGSFRLLKNVGVGVGVVPYSNMGYDYNSVDDQTSTTEKYYGEGGFSQAFLGLGWQFAKGFSIGFNVSYFWGDYNRSVLVTNSDGTVNTILRSYTIDVSHYKLDFGAQWQQKLSTDNLLTVGLIASVGHNLHADAEVVTVTTNTQTNVTTSSPVTNIDNAISLPWSFGAGVSLLHKNSLTIGADYTLQRWGSLEYPVYYNNVYSMSNNYYRDRHKVILGASWVPNPMSRKFLERVSYKVGASYATPYYKINGSDGPSEFSVTGGFSLPIGRSQVHLSGQWVRSAATGYITENMFRINLGLTFNERWFAKWKVD